MHNDQNPNSEFISGRSSQHSVLVNSLAIGTGEAYLDATSKIPQWAVARQSQIPTTLSIPRDPMAAKIGYMQPQFYYSGSPYPVKTSDANRNTHTETVQVKEGSETRNRLMKQFFLIAVGIVLCAVPLAVISTLYAQLKTSTLSTSTSASTTAAGSVTTLSIPSQCSSYTVNNDSTRSITYGPGALCDNTLATGWYRFMGGAGTQLATSAVSRDTCNTYYGGSFNGTLPQTAGLTTFGTLCLNQNGYLCYALWSGGLIGVTNCSGYYVYFLAPIINCNSRYCTTP